MTDAKHSPTIKLPLDSQLDDNFGWIQLLDNDKTVIAVVKCEHYEQIISAVNSLPGLVEALKHIRDFPKPDYPRRTEDGYPEEIIYDEFAYRRIINSYRDCANQALADAGVKP